MADIEKILLPNGDIYNIKDTTARGFQTDIADLEDRVQVLEAALAGFVVQDPVTGVLTIGGGNSNV